MLADLVVAGIEVHQIRCSQMSWNSQVLQQSSHPSLRRVHHPSHPGALLVFSIDQPIEVLDSFGNLKRLGCIIRIYQMCYCLENVAGPSDHFSLSFTPVTGRQILRSKWTTEVLRPRCLSNHHPLCWTCGPLCFN